MTPSNAKKRLDTLPSFLAIYRKDWGVLNTAAASEGPSKPALIASGAVSFSLDWARADAPYFVLRDEDADVTSHNPPLSFSRERPHARSHGKSSTGLPRRGTSTDAPIREEQTRENHRGVFFSEQSFFARNRLSGLGQGLALGLGLGQGTVTTSRQDAEGEGAGESCA